MASHRAEQCSYVDVISMETNHTRSDDIIKRVWWKCEEEEVGLLDELPERETRWREEEVEEGVCEEVERGGGGSHHDPISWTKFTRSAPLPIALCLHSAATTIITFDQQSLSLSLDMCRV